MLSVMALFGSIRSPADRLRYREVAANGLRMDDLLRPRLRGPTELEGHPAGWRAWRGGRDRVGLRRRAVVGSRHLRFEGPKAVSTLPSALPRRWNPDGGGRRGS